MALNLVNNQTYEMEPEKNGTFTPSYTGSGSLNVKQIGSVVFLTGAISITGTWADVSTTLGTLSGVSAPGTITYIPVVTYDGNLTMHNGLIIVYNGSVNVSNIESGDSVMVINAQYFA